MEENVFGIIIKVENIDICRSFYRDVLGFGPPVMDSNFWIEFQTPEGFSLFLEKKKDTEKLPDTDWHGKISWLYKVNDIDKMIERLKSYGHEPVEDEEDQKLGFRVYVFCDPEGNPFYLTKAVSREELEQLLNNIY